MTSITVTRPDGAGIQMPSTAQTALLVAAAIDGPKAHYNVSDCIDITGPLDLDRTAVALNALLTRHDMLRAGFRRSGDGWVRIVEDAIAPDLTVDDLSSLSAAAAVAEGRARAEAFADRPFDVARAPLIRFLILRLARDHHLLAVSAHHLVADGWSMGVMLRHFGEAYDTGGITRTAGDISYAEWQARYDRGPVPRQSDISAPDLPVDLPRRPGHVPQPASLTCVIGAEARARVERRARSAGVTRTAVLLAAAHDVLARWVGEASLPMGIAVANRHGRQLRNMVGLMARVETLTLAGNDDRPDATGAAGAMDRLDDVQAALRRIARPDRPTDMAAIATPISSGGPGGFRVSFNYIPWRSDQLALPGLRFQRLPLPNLFSKIDLAIYVRGEGDGGLSLELVYDGALYRPDTAGALLDRYAQTLDTLGDAAPAARDPASADSMTIGADPGPEEDAATLLDLFRAQMLAGPARIAIEHNGLSISYRALDATTDRLAAHLRAHGLKPGQTVAILARRNHHLPIALLAAWKAGLVAAIVDAGQPPVRLRVMLAMARPALILASDAADPPLVADMPVDADIPVIVLPAGIDRLDAVSTGHAETAHPGTPSPPAVIQFTSGTTGTPRGVICGHHPISAFLRWQARTFTITADDRVSLLSGIGHDPALRDIGAALISGGTLVIPDQRILDDGGIGPWLAANRITLAHLTPGMARLAFTATDIRLPALRQVFFGGDVVRPADIAACQRVTAAPGVVFYGTTETPQAAFWHVCDATTPAMAQVPIGRPVPGVRAWVVRPDGRLARRMETGTLIIGGNRLAHGYLPDAAADAAAGDDMPGFGLTGAGTTPVFRTGDRVRLDHDGRCIFVDRADRQIKIRGYRVEPAEVEAGLRALPGIADAAIATMLDADGDTRLLAAVVTDVATTPPAPPAACGIFFFGDAQPAGGDGLYGFYLAAATRADREGLRAVWTPERHFTKVAGAFPNPAILIAALASVTQQITLRAGSVVLPLHHPVRVAEDWAVIDALSHGRAELALASGWLADDFIFAPGNYADRKALVAKGISTLRHLWRGDALPLTDGAGKTTQIRIRPLPARGPLPLWMTATANPETFETAGRLGCHVLTALNNQNQAELAANIARLRRSAPLGAPQPQVALMLHCFVAETDDAARQVAAPVLRAYLREHASLREGFIAGSPDAAALKGADLDRILDHAVDRMIDQGLIGSIGHCAARLRDLGAIGVDEVAALIDFGVPQDLALDSIGRLAEAARRAGQLEDAPRHRDLTADLRPALLERLPAHMVPMRIIAMPAIPLTSNGKVDRRAITAALTVAPATGHIAPATADEVALCDILATLFDQPRIGVEDDFFRLGGYSLLALKAAARFGERTGRTLPLRAILQGRTVRGMLAAMAEMQAADSGDAAPRTPIAHAATGAGDAPEFWPLSPGQKSLMLAEELSDIGGALNVVAVLTLTGPFNSADLLAAVHAVVDRHPMLQTVFERRDDDLIQRLQPARDIRMVDTDQPDSGTDVDAMIRDLAAQPIDRFTQPPIRVRLIRLTDIDHRLVLVVHHTASDAESLRIVLSEMVAIHDAYARGERPALPAPPSHYAAFVAAMPDRPGTPAQIAATTRAAHRLAGAETVLSFPGAPLRRPGAVRAGASCRIDIDAGMAARLTAFCVHEGCTAFAVFHAVYMLVLAHYAGLSDLLCGVTTAGRPLPDHEKTVGLFADMAVTRARLDGCNSVRDLVRASAEAVAEMNAGEPVRFDWLVEAVKPRRSPDRHPLVQAVLSLHDGQMTGMARAGLAVDVSLGADTQAVLFDLMLAVTRMAHGWRLRLDYAFDVLDGAGAARFLKTMRIVLDAAITTPDADIWSLPLVDAATRNGLCGARSGHAAPPQIGRVHDLVLAQVRRDPSAIAIRWRDRAISYAELDDRSAAIGAGLIARGVAPGSVVAISMTRTPDMIAALLAVLRCGAAYLPLDPSLPQQRFAMLARHADVGLILTDDDAPGLPSTPVPSAPIGMIAAEGATKGSVTSVRWPLVASDDVASVLFTSGSTGTPKGVLIPHQGIVRLVVGTDYIAITPRDVVLHANTLSFDLSNFDIWGALANGATLALADDALPRLDAAADAIARHRVTMALLATGIFHAIAEEMPEAFAGLDHLLVAGDVLSPALCRRVLDMHPRLRLINGYGPTECATFATAWTAKAGDDIPSPVPIGRPIANTRAYVLNRGLDLVPDGMAGELVLGGIGVARGYLGQPDLTAARFLDSPFIMGDRLYRTGDIVRWREDGSLDFLGRTDHQVKIRGIRVEIGEITALILRHPAIVEAVVLPIGTGDQRQLAAFAVAADGTASVGAIRPDAEALRGWLAERLPGHLIPARLQMLAAMPLTANGKADRAALQALLAEPAAVAPTAAATLVERLIAEIIADVLNKPQVGIDQDFFDLGGSSLSGLRVVTRLRKLFATDLRLTSVFATPTAAGIAAHLVATEAQPGRTEAVARAFQRLRQNRKPAPPPSPSRGAVPSVEAARPQMSDS